MSKTSLNQIVQEAAQLFAQKGYFGTSVDDIAQAVGVRKSSIYHHIRSKDSILQQIVNDAMQRHLEALRPILADKEASHTDKLKAAITAHLQIGSSRSNEFTVLLHGFRALAPHPRAHLVDQMHEYEAGFMEIIQGGIDANEFRPVDVQLAVFDILGRCNWIFRWYHLEGRLSLEEITESLIEFTLRGIATTKGSPGMDGGRGEVMVGVRS